LGFHSQTIRYQGYQVQVLLPTSIKQSPNSIVLQIAEVAMQAILAILGFFGIHPRYRMIGQQRWNTSTGTPVTTHLLIDRKTPSNPNVVLVLARAVLQ
jgi:hypothetical protein